MLINVDLLSEHGAFIHNYLPSDLIFREGDEASHYYQIQTGVVKLNHILQNKEMIESVLMPGASVCDLLLFTNERFPVNAVAITKTSIIKIPKYNFAKLVKNDENIAGKIQQYLAKRVYNNLVWMHHISSASAEERLKGVLDYFKNLQDNHSKFGYLVPYSRAQLAAMTGLRVETVIRTVKKMEQKQTLLLKLRKIYY
jgi:CRP-like cAMP-binding protein